MRAAVRLLSEKAGVLLPVAALLSRPEPAGAGAVRPGPCALLRGRGRAVEIPLRPAAAPSGRCQAAAGERDTVRRQSAGRGGGKMSVEQLSDAFPDARPISAPHPGESEDSKVFELGATMTLLLLLFFGSDFWYLEIPIVILCSLGLLYRPLVHESNFWFLITVFLAASNFQNWYTIDTHKYLITYSCLAWCLAAPAANPLKLLRVNARLLIGLAFLFAALWKI